MLGLRDRSAWTPQVEPRQADEICRPRRVVKNYSHVAYTSASVSFEWRKEWGGTVSQMASTINKWPAPPWGESVKQTQKIAYRRQSQSVYKKREEKKEKEQCFKTVERKHDFSILCCFSHPFWWGCVSDPQMKEQISGRNCVTTCWMGECYRLGCCVAADVRVVDTLTGKEIMGQAGLWNVLLIMSRS